MEGAPMPRQQQRRRTMWQCNMRPSALSAVACSDPHLAALKLDYHNEGHPHALASGRNACVEMGATSAKRG